MSAPDFNCPIARETAHQLVGQMLAAARGRGNMAAVVTQAIEHLLFAHMAALRDVHNLSLDDIDKALDGLKACTLERLRAESVTGGTLQ